MLSFIKKFRKPKSAPQEDTGAKTSPNNVQHPLVNSFSSRMVLFLTLSTIVVAAMIISFAFVQTIRNFLLQNRTETIFSLIEQQEKRHLGDAPIFSTWDKPDSKQKFQDLEDELLGSSPDIVAIELHTPEGMLVWSSREKERLGTSPEKNEVAEVLMYGKVHNDPSASSVAELGIKDLIEVYVPIHDPEGTVVGVAEVYLNLSDIVALTQYTQMILWTLIMVSVILIFLLLHFSFQYRDAQIVTRTRELEDLAKNLEEKVRERTKQIEEEKIKDEALLASLGEGMFATDNKGTITAMNRAAEKMLQWRASEIIGKQLVEAIPAIDDHGDTVPVTERVCLIATTTGSSAKTADNVYFIKKNGGKVPVLITANPIVINKKILGAVVIFRDITKDKELEETRKNLLSLASHQLRTPLSGTKWLIETLKKGIKGSLNKDQMEYLDEIYKINDRMTELVHDMMGVLRIEGSVSQVQKEHIAVNSIFTTLLDTLNGAIKSKQITLHLPENSDIELDTDPLMLRNILECLVSNAINYSAPCGEVTVTVNKTSSECVFSIKDSGIGIPQEEQPRIFERFYRASNAKVFDTNGTGLGLYIASMLAKKIGALLSFESEENKGTTFYVHIPYSETK